MALIYHLTVDQLFSINRFGDVSADKLLFSLALTFLNASYQRYSEIIALTSYDSYRCFRVKSNKLSYISKVHVDHTQCVTDYNIERNMCHARKTYSF